MAMTRADSEALLARAPVVHLAGVSSSGQLVQRTLHGVVVGDRLAFHVGLQGEKLALRGQPVVVSAEEEVCEVPSYFLSEQRPCAATTFYRSVQLRGELQEVAAVDDKVRVLEALMRRFQPEGGHGPVTTAAAGSVRILAVSLEQLRGKAKLGAERTGDYQRQVLAGLWRRGTDADLRALEELRLLYAAAAIPEALRGLDSVSFHVAGGEAERAAAAELVGQQYWNVGVSTAELTAAHAGSAAWVYARAPDTGAVIGTARGVTDRASYCYVADVAVAEPWRGRGLGKALVALLLDHPAVRDCRRLRLSTVDAQGLYRKFGFRQELPTLPGSTPMSLDRPPGGR